jgi:hypothetical protein
VTKRPLKKPRTTPPDARCLAIGCEDHAVRSYPFCTHHMHHAYVCAYDGCEKTIAAYNKSGYCYAHRWVPQKMARARRADEYERRKVGL